MGELISMHASRACFWFKGATDVKKGSMQITFLPKQIFDRIVHIKGAQASSSPCVRTHDVSLLDDSWEILLTDLSIHQK